MMLTHHTQCNSIDKETIYNAQPSFSFSLSLCLMDRTRTRIKMKTLTWRLVDGNKVEMQYLSPCDFFFFNKKIKHWQHLNRACSVPMSMMNFSNMTFSKCLSAAQHPEKSSDCKCFLYAERKERYFKPKWNKQNFCIYIFKTLYSAGLNTHHWFRLVLIKNSPNTTNTTATFRLSLSGHCCCWLLLFVGSPQLPLHQATNCFSVIRWVFCLFVNLYYLKDPQVTLQNYCDHHTREKIDKNFFYEIKRLM